jgi:nicotinamidase-related amidase
VSSDHSESPNSRSHFLLDASRSLVMLIDVQEKLVPLIVDHVSVIESCRALLDGAKLFEVPILASEQYPEKLGRTVEPLSEFAQGCATKRMFSVRECWPEWAPVMSAPRDTVVICGIESHVCIQQSALDLLSAGWNVVIAVDAVSARRKVDHDTALQRLLWNGCTLTTVESILFEWCETSTHARFRELSTIVKNRPLKS